MKLKPLVVWLFGACAARHAPPPWDPLLFESMALRLPVDTSSLVSNTNGSTHTATTTIVTLTHAPTVWSDKVDVAPGVSLSCAVKDDPTHLAAGIQLWATATASIVVHEQQDYVARCNLGDVEVVVLVTLKPPAL